MHKTLREGFTSLLILFAIVPLSHVSAQQGTITSVIPISASTVEKYKKYEAAIRVTGTYGNVYDFDSVNVYAIINTPTNVKDTIDGFWMQDYVNPDPATHNLSLAGVPSFRIRYSPKEIGAYSYIIYVKDRTGIINSSTYNFASTVTNSKGFIRKNNSNYLSHDDGSAFIPIGQNMAYTTGYLYPDYNKWMDSAALYNQNLIRAWATSDAFGLEWKAGHSLAYAQFEGLKKYEQKRAWALDWLLNKASNKNMYVMLTQLVHNEMLTGTNGPRWNDNPYNIINGGMCDATWDFYKNPLAIKVFKNRMRYMVARYGYSTSIESWELTNEINNTDGFYEGNKENIRLWVRQWHDTMATYLKKIDLNKHLVTTSYGGYDYNDHDSATWHIPSLDVSSWHWYDASATPQTLAKAINTKYLADFNKPTQQGEAGWSLQQPNGFENIDINGVQLHNLIWASAFSGAMGPAIEWNWDDFIAPRKLNYHYKYIQTATSKFDLAQGNFKPVATTTSITENSPGFTLLIKPMGPGFSLPANHTSFNIDNEGEITPAVEKLGIMLMGSSANTQFRSPPSFTINYLNAGTFTVETVAVATGGAKVSIYVDGVLSLNVSASPNSSYTVNISAGPHIIKLDNLGSDWLQAKDFRFGNAGNPLGTTSLKNNSNTKVVGHILNKNYNWKWFADSTGQPAAVTGAVLHVPVIVNGEYLVTFKNTFTNTTLSTENILVTTGNLTAAIPTISWDAYYTIEPITTIPNQPPAANAGADKTITLPTHSTTFNGSGTDADGTIVSYAWIKISGPSAGVLNNATAANANVNNLLQGLYSYQLTVTDNVGATAKDTVTVTVNVAVNQAPSANSGADKMITLPTNSTTLNGSGTDSDGTIVSYAWIKISGPLAGDLNNATAANANVTNLVQGVYSYQLTVTDNAGTTAKDTVTVTVNTAFNQPPSANSGADKMITLPTNSTTLNGTGTDADGTIISYAWVKVSGPSTGVLNNANVATCNATNLIQGLYSYQLTVTNNAGATAKDTVTVTVNAAVNQAPSASSGEDKMITLPVNSTTLNGSGTDADGTISSYAWIKISGPLTGILNSANAATSNATNLVQGLYFYQLTVTDNAGATAKDTVTVTVNAAVNQAPSASSGADKTITLPTNSTTLNGTGTDADGTIISYAWVKVSGPSTAVLNNATAANANVTYLIQGLYSYQLTVTDNAGATAKDTVTVTVNAAINQAPSANSGADKMITLPVNSTTLNGSGTDADGTISSYAWIKILGPSTGVLNNVNAATANVTNLVQGVYSYQLAVTDNAGTTAKDTVTVTVNAVINQAPSANSGADKMITLPVNSTTLNGSGTDADGTIGLYAWIKISGPSAGVLNNANAATCTATNLIQGLYSYQLTVTDNAGATGKDTMTVIVNAAGNQLPKANAGTDITIYLPLTYTLLSGSGTDADGSIVAYKWRVIGGPAQSVLSSPATAVTNIKNLRQGIYKIEFSVKDNAGAVGYDTLTVNVLNKKNNASLKLNVYPNPVTNLLNVEVLNAETDMQSFIILYDSKGSMLYKKTIPVFESKKIQQVDMSRLDKGNYFLHVKYGTEPPIVKPIIKM